MRTRSICLALAIVLMCTTASAQGVHTNVLYPHITLTMYSGGGGKVSPSCPCPFYGVQCVTVRISALPDSGYHFIGWTGIYTGPENPHDLYFCGDCTETGFFAPGTTQATVRINDTPPRFNLEQNYPDPFNPSTTIRYELPKASQVNLSVYDILGREVSVLVNEKKDAGIYEVRYEGSKLASGVYFYRLQAGDYVASKKMLVLK
jgi:hypothetical protein